MQTKSPDIALFQHAAQLDCSMNWYAISDSAQHSALPKAIAGETGKVRCLLDAPLDSPLAQQSPHLVELRSPLQTSRAWNWISSNAKKKPCVSIVATQKSFEDVFEQFSGCLEIVLPDGEGMYLAFWDPAILGTLMGQADDRTLHVKGPVLSLAQQSKLMNEASGWWYWDRLGEIHLIPPRKKAGEMHVGPVVLSQRQVDDLVEASVPDHTLYHIKANQPHLLDGVAHEKRYELVSHALGRARMIGLVGMRDMVNYVCVELIYKERMKEYVINNIFEDVRSGRIQFEEALDRLP